MRTRHMSLKFLSLNMVVYFLDITVAPIRYFLIVLHIVTLQKSRLNKILLFF